MTDVQEVSRAFVRAAERGTTLYELSAEWNTLLDALEDGEADEATIEDQLAKLGGAIKEKSESIAGLIRWCEGLAEMRKAEAKRMTDGAKRFENKASWLRSYLLQHMRAMELPKIETGRFTIAVRQNPPAVEVLEEMLIPQEFKRVVQEVVIDKRGILEHLKTTGEVPAGVEIRRGESLRIS